MNKEYVFVGNAQNKTRDFINQLIKENKELKNTIKQLMNNTIPTSESLILSRRYKDKDLVTYKEVLEALEELDMENDYLKNTLEDIKASGEDYDCEKKSD